jgi:molybdopterin-guanine dinucleotide biosynthesis protein A
MHVLILAGGSASTDDPLYPFSQGAPKSLIELAGKPITQWVIDALTESHHIDNLFVIGLEPDSGLSSQKPLHFISDQGDVLSNIMHGFKEIQKNSPQASHVLLASGDIPMINEDVVNWRVESANELNKDVHYTVVDRSTMEARFPGADRTYLRLKDGAYCGADLNVVKLSALEKEHLWDRLAESRKSPLKQAALIGLDSLFLILLRQLTLADAGKRVAKRMDLQVDVAISPFAEIAMDIDTPHQLELLRSELEQREDSRS